MNRNQSDNMTQKQRELVKKLEEIRLGRDGMNQKEKQPTPTQPKRRNEKSAQNREQAKKPVKKKRKRTASQEKFARPVEKTPKKMNVSPNYQRDFDKRQQSIRRPTKVTPAKKIREKKDKRFIDQLSDGNKLSQAIVLSEILDKPVALRRRR